MASRKQIAAARRNIKKLKLQEGRWGLTSTEKTTGRKEEKREGNWEHLTE